MAHARYTLTLTIDQPMEDDDTDVMYTDRRAQRRLERDVLTRMRTLDGDCDCEVMTVEILHDDEPEISK